MLTIWGYFMVLFGSLPYSMATWLSRWSFTGAGVLRPQDLAVRKSSGGPCRERHGVL